MILTYRYRIRDGRGSDRAALRAQARAVNWVWNYLCSIQREAERRWRAGTVSKWPTAFEFTYLTAGACKELGILSVTVKALCHAFVDARDRAGHCPRWRSARTHLDWVPIAAADEHCRLHAGCVIVRKRRYRLWWSRDLPADAVFKTGSFACDARGRWYFNLALATEEVRPHGTGEVGIDLGLRHLAALSSGETVQNLRYTARYAEELAKANRSQSKRRIRAVHAKIANSRRDHLHKVSTAIMRANWRVVVGNVSASKLVKTKFAKSVLDAGWSSFRSMLSYKAITHQVDYAEVEEAWTSRTCSACGTIPASSPKGMSALGMREWTCSDCGAVHDRDVNAARNILGAERRPPAEGIARLGIGVKSRKLRSATKEVAR